MDLRPLWTQTRRDHRYHRDGHLDRSLWDEQVLQYDDCYAMRRWYPGRDYHVRLFGVTSSEGNH